MSREAFIKSDYNNRIDDDLLVPSDRFLAGLVVMVFAALLTSIESVALILTGAISAFLFSYHRKSFSFRAFLAINSFLAFLICTMPLTSVKSVTDPAIIPLLSSVGFHTGYLKKACTIALKSNALYFLFLFFLRPVPLSYILSILSKWNVPASFITLLHLVIRHITSIRKEAKALYTAASLRGFSPTNSLRSYKVMAYLLAMLFIRCHDMVKRTSDAMLLRGFTGKWPLFLPCLPPTTIISRFLTWLLITFVLLLTLIDRTLF